MRNHEPSLPHESPAGLPSRPTRAGWNILAPRVLVGAGSLVTVAVIIHLSLPRSADHASKAPPASESTDGSGSAQGGNKTFTSSNWAAANAPQETRKLVVSSAVGGDAEQDPHGDRWARFQVFKGLRAMAVYEARPEAPQEAPVLPSQLSK